jgi:hypothetical protein
VRLYARSVASLSERFEEHERDLLSGITREIRNDLLSGALSFCGALWKKKENVSTQNI